MTAPSRSLAAFLVARLREPLPGPNAQLRFAPVPRPIDWAPDRPPATARPAAAVVLIYPGAAGPTVALTRRREDLPQHPGQISLPGGAIDPGETAESAALREVEEEIGVPSQDVRLVGPLSRLWIPQSQFVLSPFVGLLDHVPVFDPHVHEVAEMIEAPLDVLRDPTRIGWTRRDRRGASIAFPYFDVNGAHVWGATAMVLGEFVCLWDADRAPAPPPNER